MKRATLAVIAILLGTALAQACGQVSLPSVAPAEPVATLPAATTAGAWWSDAVFYEIFVRSFYDTDGDGIGDFNGVTERLDYLQDLGVTGLWLMPINPSPSYHGYDVTDYYAVNPEYGTIGDFRRLLSEAHRRGIRVIIDLVLNHTSSLHPWFVESNSSPQSPYRDWYIWSETDPGYLGPWGERAWHPGEHGFYYGVFSDAMPDLNYRTAEVTAQMEDVARYWLQDIGVDGFRLDAAKHLVEEGQRQENTRATHKWYEGFFAACKTDNPDTLLVGEVYGSDAFTASTYTTTHELDLVFNFELASGLLNSARSGAASAVNSALTFAEQDLPEWQFATFLTNHDQNRVMTVLNGDTNRARVAAALLLTSPGVPFIYYGEEIGMEGGKPDEDIRRPMQWSADANAGFTSGMPWRAPASNYSLANVAMESADPDSLLSFYEQLITIRNQHPALRSGALSLLSTGNPGVYSALRTNENEAILIVVNLTEDVISDYGLALEDGTLEDGPYNPEPLLGPGTTASLNVRTGGFNAYRPFPELPAHGVRILLLRP